MTRWAIQQFRRQGGLRTLRDGVPDDLFLVCASYEPRTVAVVDSLSPAYRANKGIIYVNREFLEGFPGGLTRSNLDHLAAVLRRHCDAVEVANGSWLDPKTQLISLRDVLIPGALAQAKDPLITLDATTFNREALLTAAVLLRTNFDAAPIRTLYVSPEDHGDWLSRGFRCIRNVMAFAGLQRSNQPTTLVVLSGFEPERTLKTIEEHEPAKVLLGLGEPPTTERFLQRNLNEQKLVLARQEVERFSFPANDIKLCWHALETLLTPYLAQHNVIVAPMSTKLSTLATLPLAERHPEIQITYCVPGEYNIANYSRGADSIFVDLVPYGTSQG